MTPPPDDWKTLLPDLLAALDEEIALLGLRTRQFEELYDAILHRKNDRMETVLEDMTRAQQQQVRLDETLRSLRAHFARSLGRGPHDLRLCELADRLEADAGRRLREKRQQILLLAERLKRKHLLTAILLGESARINRLILESLLPRTDAVTTYGVSGAKPWHTSSGLVDAEM